MSKLYAFGRSLGPCLMLVAASLVAQPSVDAEDAAPPPAVGADSPEAACPTGNLLSAKAVASSKFVANPERLTDGKAALAGDIWNSGFTSVFRSTRAHATYDLGAPTKIDALFLQGDNNDEYRVEGSHDGKEFFTLWEAIAVRGAGMRDRITRDVGKTTRYLRVVPVSGDNAYSIAEFQAFCGQPSAWPPKVERENATAWWWRKLKSKKKERRKVYLGLFALLAFIGLYRKQAGGGAVWQAAMVGGGLGALGFAVWRLRQTKLTPWFDEWGIYWVGGLVLLWMVGAVVAIRRGTVRGVSRDRWLEQGAMVFLILASAATWTNFGQYHGPRFVHYWDSFHYYVGSKYFKELGYEHMYDCVQAADFEDHGARDFRNRKARDLRSNILAPIKIEDVQQYVGTCQELFGEERWTAFRQDTRLFRSEMGASWWKNMIEDHGYNATPVSNMVGTLLSNTRWRAQVPPEELRNVAAQMSGKTTADRSAIAERFRTDRGSFASRMKRFGSIDMFLYFAAFAMILWAFGSRACALTMAVWAAGYPWAYFWTGGSFARVPWFFMIAASVCLLKKGYPLIAGFALSWSALLRLFPAAFAGGGLAKLADRFIRRKKIDGPWITKAQKRFVMGGIAGVLILGAASAATSGTEAYETFIGNTLKHNSTALTNHMGLPTLLSWHPSKVGRYLKDESLEEPWAVWKEARNDTLHSRKWLHIALLLGFMVLLAVASRRLEDWAITAAGGLMVIGMFQLTCYYYTFMALLAPIALRRLRYVVAILLMSLTTQILPFFIGWYDEQYQAETLAALLFMLYLLVDIARSQSVAHESQPT